MLPTVSFAAIMDAWPPPIVYHDADKELLLTFFPPELNMPLD